MAAMDPKPRGFDNGIKPTHLWHKTGRRHFYRMMQDMFKVHSFYVPPKKQQIIIQTVVFSSALGMAYTFSRLDPEKYVNYYYRGITGTAKAKSLTPTIQPVPPKSQLNPAETQDNPQCMCELPEEERPKKRDTENKKKK